MSTTYAEVIKEAEQLSESDQNKLIYHLRIKQALRKSKVAANPNVAKANQVTNASTAQWQSPDGIEDGQLDSEPTRQDLLDELAILRTLGAFENAETLYGKFANANASALSAEVFHTMLHNLATEWEPELDELTSTNH